MDKKYQILEQGQALPYTSMVSLTHGQALALFRNRCNALSDNGWKMVYDVYRDADSEYCTKVFYNPRTYEATTVSFMPGDEEE